VIPELLLGSVLAAAAGGAGFLVRQSIRERQAHEEEKRLQRQAHEEEKRLQIAHFLRERQAHEEEKRLQRQAHEEEKRLQIAHFREALVREIRGRKLAEFSFSDFVAFCEIPRAEADRIADDIYTHLCRTVLDDGVVTLDEQRKMMVLAKALEISKERAERIELEIKGHVYRRTVEDVLADGVVSD
jgi:hypothetical protein